MNTEALRRACEVTGGQLPLAKRIGVTQSMVWYWLERSKKGVPAEYAAAIERATDGAVKAHELRPDIFEANRMARDTASAEATQ
jgi:DNA-binding transcriptional regulator YdaS (Cro superfamily)